MAYVHYINGYKYGIKIISYNHYEVLKNGLHFRSCDTYEEAQDVIDNISSIEE